MLAGFRKIEAVDTPRAFSAPPIPTARGLGTSPWSKACSGEVDMGSASAAVDAVAARAPPPRLPNPRPNRRGGPARVTGTAEGLTAGTLQSRRFGDEFSSLARRRPRSLFTRLFRERRGFVHS